MAGDSGSMTRIAIFYDGSYFSEVSDYYRYVHARQSRIDLNGLHEFIRHKAADMEGREVQRAQIVEAHYFRGRFSAEKTIEAGKLEGERRFDDVLTRVGITQHYHPMDERAMREKGIDVWLALEAFDRAVHKRFEVVCLIACDGDYVPLVRKLNSIGTRVMVMAWDLQYEDDYGNTRFTRTSEALIRECSYPVLMHQEIESRSNKGNSYIDGLFLG